MADLYSKYRKSDTFKQDLFRIEARSPAKPKSKKLSLAQDRLLPVISQYHGLLATHGPNGPAFTLRDSSVPVSGALVKKLIDARALVPDDEGLLTGFAQSYRVRLPQDGLP